MFSIRASMCLSKSVCDIDSILSTVNTSRQCRKAEINISLSCTPRHDRSFYIFERHVLIDSWINILLHLQTIRLMPRILRQMFYDYIAGSNAFLVCKHNNFVLFNKIYYHYYQKKFSEQLPHLSLGSTIDVLLGSSTSVRHIF